ncbi:MAG: redoxin domain-containing protein [Gammaproteobacteria bacterium]
MLSNPPPFFRKAMLAVFALLTLLTLLPLSQQQRVDARSFDNPVPAPAFTGKTPDQWINSEPLTWTDLRGKVVLMDIWTFECWNCYRSFPWLNDLEARLKDQGLQVIGIHSPEFEREKDRDAVIAKKKEFDLKHPTMMDNDFSYWKALNNRYWPAFYLVDKQGRIRARYVGETHAGDSQAEAIEREIRALLKE